MRFYLIRHPRPAVAPEFCYGRTDLPADTGELQRVAATLGPGLPADVPIYTSPLVRCTALASMLGAAQADERLTETDFGRWEMQSWASIPRAEIDAWASDMVNFRPGGGESILQAAQRVQSFYQQLMAQPAAACIVVAHAAVIRLLQACTEQGAAEQVALRAASSPQPIAFGELVVMQAPL